MEVAVAVEVAAEVEVEAAEVDGGGGGGGGGGWRWRWRWRRRWRAEVEVEGWRWRWRWRWWWRWRRRWRRWRRRWRWRRRRRWRWRWRRWRWWRRRWRWRRRWWRRWRPATRRVDGIDVRDVSGVPRRRPDIGRRAVGREGGARIHDLVRAALQRQGRLPDRRPVRSVPAANRPGHAELGPVPGNDDRAVGAHGRMVDDLTVEEDPVRVACRAYGLEVAEAAREIDGAVGPDARC